MSKSKSVLAIPPGHSASGSQFSSNRSSSHSNQSSRHSGGMNMAALQNHNGGVQNHDGGSYHHSVATNKSDTPSTKSFTSKFCFLSWNEDESHSLREFVSRFSLPRVVRVTNYEELSIIKTLFLPSEIDISQPILLYKKYRPIKIQGKCLKLQKNGKLKEVGSSLILPDSFPGWFSLLSPDGKECAMTLTSMGQIAAARVPAFLTKFDVPVYKLTESHEAGVKSVYIRSSVQPGSVLRLLGIWADLGPGSNSHHPGLGGIGAGGSVRGGQFSSSYFSNGPAGFNAGRKSLGGFGGRLVARSLSHHVPQQQQPSQFQYIQCLNQENEVLFVPFSATGVFYPIAPRGGRNPQHIYPLSAIARIQRLPLRIKLVFGALPTNLPDFSGTFELENVNAEDIILACTLLKEKPTLFELDPDCDLFLSQMMSDDLFIKSASYLSALNYCKTEGEHWKRQIKPCQNSKKIPSRKGTITSAVLKKSLRLRSSNSSNNNASSPTSSPSKLSLLFRPNSFGQGNNPGNNGKDPLRRSKSFNIETQSVSLSLAPDYYEDQDSSTTTSAADCSNKRLSSLFNFMSTKKYQNGSKRDGSILPSGNQPSLSNGYSKNQKCLKNGSSTCKSDPEEDDEVPYGRVVDELQHENEKEIVNHRNGAQRRGGCADEDYESENIYSEIPDEFALKLNIMNPMSFHLPCHHQQHRHHILVEGSGGSNMSSLIKGGGGSDGAFSGTFSSSNPSSTEEDIYDNIF